ncbi:MAG: hypothetical protein IPP94_17765 [Ignavibacteria bacterium]|nr:hypothetical protein [Ignavibacteria bacterium]
MARRRRKPRETASRSCRLFALFLVLGCVADPWQAWSQSTAFEFFPLYDGMERSYTVRRFN